MAGIAACAESSWLLRESRPHSREHPAKQRDPEVVAEYFGWVSGSKCRNHEFASTNKEQTKQLKVRKEGKQYAGLEGEGGGKNSLQKHKITQKITPRTEDIT